LRRESQALPAAAAGPGHVRFRTRRRERPLKAVISREVSRPGDIADACSESTDRLKAPRQNRAVAHRRFGRRGAHATVTEVL